MTLDIRGGLKNTAINASDYAVFEELFSNAIDSYLIRKKAERDAPPCLISIHTRITATDLLQDEFDIEISCLDNGAGFGDDQVKAFITKDSTYKDQLQIQGIGKCKGAGRIQFFHHFHRLTIDSVITKGGQVFRRTLSVDESSREISKESFVETSASGASISTIFKLKGHRSNPIPAEQKTERGATPDVFSAPALARHLYTSFLQRLVILKALIGNFQIKLTSVYKNNEHTLEAEGSIESKDLPMSAEKLDISLVCTHAKEPRIGTLFHITRYSFPKDEFPNFEHEVALCANSAVVQQITRRYLKSGSVRQRPTNGNFELILAESERSRSLPLSRIDFLPPECVARAALLSRRL